MTNSVTFWEKLLVTLINDFLKETFPTLAVSDVINTDGIFVTQLVSKVFIIYLLQK